jgi:flavin-dependent dehydrogenase
MDKTISIRKKCDLREEKPDEYSLKAHYLDQMQFTPGLRELLKNATLKEDINEPIKSASDYSYSATSYAGDHYRLVGDAAGTIHIIVCP